jgi:hypothetical protein
MRLQLLFILALPALATSHLLQLTSSAPSLANLTHDASIRNDTKSDIPKAYTPTIHTTANPPTKFEKAVSIGLTLNSAMKSKDSVARWFFKDFPQFAETCQSPFTGDGRAELATWGYDDSDALSATVAKECDFDVYHGIKAAFDELGLDTKGSKDGGPNHCFKVCRISKGKMQGLLTACVALLQVNHRDGVAIKRNPDGSLPNEAKQFYDVCGKTYQVSPNTPHHERRALTLFLHSGNRRYLRVRRKPTRSHRPHEHHVPFLLRKNIHPVPHPLAL